jgi:hypothetical protein
LGKEWLARRGQPGKINEGEKDPDTLLEGYRQYLAQKPLDITTLYLQVRSSRFGHDYDKPKFLRTPLKELFRVLEFVFEEEKRSANIQSIATAKLAMIVIQIAQGYAGNKKPSTITIDDLLPFALNTKMSEIESETGNIVAKLTRESRLPIHVIAALSKVISLKQSS